MKDEWWFNGHTRVPSGEEKTQLPIRGVTVILNDALLGRRATGLPRRSVLNAAAPRRPSGWTPAPYLREPSSGSLRCVRVAVRVAPQQDVAQQQCPPLQGWASQATGGRGPRSQSWQPLTGVATPAEHSSDQQAQSTLSLFEMNKIIS